MDNAKKHPGRLRKQIDTKFGKGKSNEILAGIDALAGNKMPTT